MKNQRDYPQEISEKTEMIRVITDSLLQGKFSLQEARDRLSLCIEASRPMVKKATRNEMADRLSESEQWAEQFKLQSLYRGFLPMPYNPAYLSSPIKTIIASHQAAASQLLELDQLEEDNPSINTWHCQYQALLQTLLRLQKRINQALPFLEAQDVPAARGQAQTIQSAGDNTHEKIHKLLSLLTKGEPYEFLIAHRQWMQKTSAYLDYVEIELLPLMLANITGQPQYMEVARLEASGEQPRKTVYPPMKAIFGETKIMDLIYANQKLGEGFFKIDPQMEGLKGPLGMEMLKEATVEMLAKSLGITTDDLIERIHQTINA